GRRRGLREPHRLAAGRRAVRARRPGRVRRVLRGRHHRRRVDHRDHADAMSYFDDPNREAVGLEPAWAEGFGGEPGAGPAGDPQADLDAMTKDQLLAEADKRGVEVERTATKAEIREALGA